MVFKHFPLRGTDSISASIASQCPGEQCKFWEYYDILYENQGAGNSGLASKDRLKALAYDKS
jgi:protein-disulfide isomerase